MKHTPEKIERLKDNQIFVFGSNMGGYHCRGAAREAYRKWGAKWGIASGLSGRSYAVPTLTRNGQKLMLQSIGTSIVRLYNEAKAMEDYEFLVTKIGCGIAGFTPEEIIPLFRKAEKIVGKLDNIVLPEGWD